MHTCIHAQTSCHTNPPTTRPSGVRRFTFIRNLLGVRPNNGSIWGKRASGDPPGDPRYFRLKFGGWSVGGRREGAPRGEATKSESSFAGRKLVWGVVYLRHCNGECVSGIRRGIRWGSAGDPPAFWGIRSDFACVLAWVSGGSVLVNCGLW